MIVKLLSEHHFEFLSLRGGCRGSSESKHVKMPHCWKSHALALNNSIVLLAVATAVLLTVAVYIQGALQNDPDQDRRPDMGPNCLQRLSAGRVLIS